MKVKTINPVSAQQWLDQVQRFAKVSKNVSKNNVPKTEVTNLHAEIEIDILEPLTKGFEAKVTYYQYFQKPFEETTTDVKHLVVQYIERIPRDMVNVMISQFTDNIPSELTDYLDIQDWIIEQGVLQQIVSKHTFGGLLAQDYIIEK